MAGGKLSFLAMDVVLLIVFLGSISIVFDLHGFFFVAEFLFMGVLALLALIAMVSVYNNIKFGWTLMSFALAFILINLFFIYLARKPASTTLLLTAVAGLIGFLISVVSMGGPEEAEGIKSKRGNSRVKKEFKPGKYIASKTGKKFHSPKCDWAKKVKKQNAVWFNSAEEAKKAGYKADDCVK